MPRRRRRARICLDLSAQVPGDDLDDDTRGRILFVRGIAHHFLGFRGMALDDVDEALRLLSLERSPGYFPDAVSFVACFLQGGDEARHDERALEILDRFRCRLKEVEEFTEVRDRIRWAEGLIMVRLGHTRRGRARLERARRNHYAHSPHRWVLAIAVDEALTLCRRHPESHIRSIGRIIKFCKEHLKLEDEHRKRLRQAAQNLGRAPWSSREILGSLRRSYTVPVPGLLCDVVRPEEEEEEEGDGDGAA